jgi:protein-tyrosine phosphatase
LLSLDESFSDPLVITDLTQPFATVSNLFVGARYYWKVRAEGKRIEPVESAVWSFQTHPAMPRWVYVPGVTNMRDIGGWELSDGRRVRQGAVYRSSAISTRRVQAQTACILIEELRVRTDLDLRAMREGARPMLDESLVQWRHVPVLAYESLATDEGLVQYREALRVFADPTNYPILCHCRAGADRVGTLVLLLLGLLGVELDDLAQDYELTSLSVWGKRSRHSGAFQAVLGCLKEFGGRPDATINEQIEGYALHAGLTPQEITRIRDTLLVSADSAS